MKRLLITLLAGVAFAPQLHATVSFILQADRLKAAGGSPMDSRGLWLLVASTVDGSFAIDGLDGATDYIVAGASTALGSIIGGSDDLVVARGELNDFAVDGVLDVATRSINYQDPIYGGASSKWNANDPLALLWFPELTTASSVVSEGRAYGFYTNAVAADGSSPWESPGDGTTNRVLVLYTQDGDFFSPGAIASNPAAAGNASLSAIPEPSALLLAAAAAPLFGQRRRRTRD